MKTVKGTVDVSSIKRCYVDVIIEAKCPQCKSVLKCDFDGNYLMYPHEGQEVDACFVCDKCEIEDKTFEWVMPILIGETVMSIIYDTEGKLEPA